MKTGQVWRLQFQKKEVLSFGQLNEIIFSKLALHLVSLCPALPIQLKLLLLSINYFSSLSSILVVSEKCKMNTFNE